MYKISLPILGFEHISQAQINKQDDHISTLILEDKQQIHMVNITYFKNMPLNFNIDDKALKRLHIHIRSDFEIFFCIVIQDPVEESIVNLTAPILINKKNNLLGQYIIKDKIPKLFTTLE